MMHHSKSNKILSLTHWNLSDTDRKFQLCTCNLTFTTHESNYVYRYVRFEKGYSYKAIFTLSNGHFEHWCIIQYRWKFFPSHWNVSDTFNKFQLCTSNLKVPTHESNYVYRYVRYAYSFKDKSILTLGNQDFELGCIIQYRWIFCP